MTRRRSREASRGNGARPRALEAALVARVHAGRGQVIAVAARVAGVIGVRFRKAAVIQRGLCRRAAVRERRVR